jgi:hypothetical protein
VSKEQWWVDCLHTLESKLSCIVVCYMWLGGPVDFTGCLELRGQDMDWVPSLHSVGWGPPGPDMWRKSTSQLTD